MFDFGFSEIVLIFIVALLVIGPERLPRVARTAGLWLGRLRSFVQTVKADIDQELATEDLKRQLREAKDMTQVREIIEEADNVGREAKETLEQERDYLVKAVAPESQREAWRAHNETILRNEAAARRADEDETRPAEAAAHKPLHNEQSGRDEFLEASGSDPSTPATGNEQQSPDESVNERTR